MSRTWLRSLFAHPDRTDRARQGMPRPHGGIRGPNRRTQLRVEALEDRTLLTATPLGVTFVEGGVTLPELALTSYSWGAANATGGHAPSLQDLTLTLAPSSVEPGLWGHLTAGTHLNSAAIHVRQTIRGALTEYITYTLTNVFISSFSLNGSALPQDTIQLHFDEVTEQDFPINPNGTLGSPNTADYNQAKGQSLNAGSLAGPTTGASTLGLTFVEGGVTQPELAVASYSWGAANATGGHTPSLEDLTLTLAPSSVEPGLWGHLTAGIHLSSATVHVRQTIRGALTEYITYTLTNVFLSSFTTAENSNSSPQDTIQLHFDEVKEQYVPNGTPPNTADYNQARGQSVNAGSLAGPATGATSLGLTFVEGGVTQPELAVSSYSWGAANATGGHTPSLEDLTLTLAPTSVEPGLWGHLTAGTLLSSAIIHVRKPLGTSGVLIEYVTYTLTNVFLSSFTTTDNSNSGPQDTIQLHFDELKEQDLPINDNGTLGNPNTADYNQAKGQSVNAGSLAGPTTGTTSLGLTFVEGGVTQPELAVTNYSWGAADPTGGHTPSLQDLTLTLAPTSMEPGLWGHLTAGTLLNSATIHVRKPLGTSGALTEYITYTLTNVFLSSFTTAENSNSSPQDTIQLHFDEVKEQDFPINNNGTLGNPNIADYNQARGQSVNAGSLAGPTTGTPSLGLTFVEGGVTLAELALTNYSWGAANATGGHTPSLQDLTLTLAPTSVEPGLWGHLTAGTLLNSATLHVRQLVTGVLTEYITYTLTNVFLSSFTTADNNGTAPQDTIQLHFDEVKEEYVPNGTPPNVADYNQARGRSVNAGSLAGPPLSSAPPLGLSFVEGSVTQPELAVSSYSWGAANATGGITPSMQDLTLTLAPGFVEPGLWGHLTAGTHLTSASIHVRQRTKSGLTEYITYTMKNVFLSSFTTADNSNSGPQDTIQLHFDEMTESYFPIDPYGNLLAPANTADYNWATRKSGGAGIL